MQREREWERKNNGHVFLVQCSFYSGKKRRDRKVFRKEGLSFPSFCARLWFWDFLSLFHFPRLLSLSVCVWRPVRALSFLIRSGFGKSWWGMRRITAQSLPCYFCCCLFFFFFLRKPSEMCLYSSLSVRPSVWKVFLCELHVPTAVFLLFSPLVLKARCWPWCCITKWLIRVNTLLAVFRHSSPHFISCLVLSFHPHLFCFFFLSHPTLFSSSISLLSFFWKMRDCLLFLFFSSQLVPPLHYVLHPLPLSSEEEERAR